jgi:hypothetical protein
METNVRIIAAAIGLLIALLARRPLARAITASPSRAASVVMESMMVGEKLLWSETIPATSQLLGIQSANIAVSGYASDQAYLRLASELPRFKHPVAVMSLFTPAIFDRNSTTIARASSWG